MAPIQAKDLDIYLSFSGGMDSTLVLYKLLKLGHNVLVHHVRYTNAQGRDGKEYEAVEKTLAWLSSHPLRGRYRYLESAVDVSQHPNFVRDSYVWGFFTGSILSLDKYAHIKRVATGRHLNSYSGFRNAPKAIEQTRTIYQEVLPLLAGRPIDLVHPIGDMTKLQIVQELPEDLRELCWSCRRPTPRGARCHRCMTCRQIDKALQGVEVAPHDWESSYQE